MRLPWFTFILLTWLHTAYTLTLPQLPSLPSLFHSMKTYKEGENVDLIVNTVSSKKSNIPYSYYNLPFICPPTENVKPVYMSLAEILHGDNFMQSDYVLNFKKDEPCFRLCDRIMKNRNIKKSINLIQNDYIADWLIDGLPGSTTFISDSISDENKKYYVPGFPIGYTKGDDTFINNHIMMVIRYNVENDNSYSIVGFEIYPKSVDSFNCPGASKKFDPVKLDPNADSQLIHFTYSVYWREEPSITYSNRWNYYLDPSIIDSNGNLITSKNKSIHWISLINSFVLISLVSLALGFIFLITFKTSSSNTVSTSPSPFLDIAHAAFDKPVWPHFLSILIGSGVQLIFTTLTTGLVSLLFIKNTFGHETTTLSAAVAILIIGGFFAGFSSIQLLKLLLLNSKLDSPTGQISYKKTIIVSSLSGSLVISICLLTIHIANRFIFDEKSPRALTFSTFMTILLVYTLLQIPISAIGGIISKNINFFTSIISKKIIKQHSLQKPSLSSSTTSSRKSPAYLRFPLSLLIIGFFPCCVVFIESRFAYLSFLSIRNSNSSYIFGFLILTAILLAIITIEIGVVATYVRLCKNPSVHNWQWWTFLNFAFSIWIYLMLTSLYQLMFKINVRDSGSPVLYVVYTTIINSLIAISCGALALWSATAFIYATVLSSTLKSD